MQKLFQMMTAFVVGFMLLILLTCADSSHTPTPLETAVDMNRVKFHQFMLQSIADQNNHNRFPGTPGFERSVEYIISWLELAGYEPVLQELDFVAFREVSPAVFNQESPHAVFYPPDDPEGFMTFEYSGSGDVTALVQPVDLIIPMPYESPPNTSTSGCEVADFDGFIPGRIALLQRGNCSFRDKVANAEAAGAAGVIIMNEGQPDRTVASSGSLGDADFSIPAVFANYHIGVEIYSLIQDGQAVRVHMKVNAVLETIRTVNILADTPGGDDARTVVVGAHLDSVAKGPGMNDNGSGCAAILEIAYKIGLAGITPANKIRFAFWSAEEHGLLGSEHYVANLSPEELAKISLYLNADMIASPNYIRFVLDGDGSGSDSPYPGPPGSEKIEKLFNDYFAAMGLPTEPSAINGSSDYGSFADRNIPVGGVNTGASEIKTEEMAQKYGGIAGEACDPNYHTARDTVDNLNYTIQEQMLKAIAHAVYTYGNTPLDSYHQQAMLTQNSNIKYRSTYKGPFAVE
jgi:Zn-dependent M28 family amino/carboxypeptidase